MKKYYCTECSCTCTEGNVLMVEHEFHPNPPKEGVFISPLHPVCPTCGEDELEEVIT